MSAKAVMVLLCIGTSAGANAFLTLGLVEMHDYWLTLTGGFIDACHGRHASSFIIASCWVWLWSACIALGLLPICQHLMAQGAGVINLNQQAEVTKVVTLMLNCRAWCRPGGGTANAAAEVDGDWRVEVK